MRIALCLPSDAKKKKSSHEGHEKHEWEDSDPRKRVRNGFI